MTARVFIIGGTLRSALAWCRDNRVQPYAMTTVIATRSLRGFEIRPEDRVVWLEPVAEALVEDVMISQLATGANHTPPPPPCPKCGKPEDSFACRIRHIHMNTGDAKASRDIDGGKR